MQVGDFIIFWVDGNPKQQKIVDIQEDENGNIVTYTTIDILSD